MQTPSCFCLDGQIDYWHSLPGLNIPSVFLWRWHLLTFSLLKLEDAWKWRQSQQHRQGFCWELSDLAITCFLSPHGWKWTTRRLAQHLKHLRAPVLLTCTWTYSTRCIIYYLVRAGTGSRFLISAKKNRTLKLAYRTKISLLKHNPPVPAPFSTLNMRRVEKCGRQQCAKDSFRTKCIKSSDPQSLWKNVRWVETAEGIERRRKKKEERKERRDLCLLS